MLVKIKRDGTELLELARFCGAAPCAIVLANGVRTEAELGQEIFVPVTTVAMVRKMSSHKDIASLNILEYP